MSEDNFDETQAVATQAEGEFDLLARLKGRQLRTGSITVYTDEVTAAKHLAVEEKLQNLSDHSANLLALAERATALDLPSAADALKALAAEETVQYGQEEYTKLEAERDALLASLNSTSITFEMAAVPEIVVKDARRKSKLGLKITGSNVPEGLEQEYSEYFTAVLFVDAITGFTDHASGAKAGRLNLETAKALADYLPPSEFRKLSAKLGDVQYKQVIGESVTNSADF